MNKSSKNIPLSVDDGINTRDLILKDLEVISDMRVKLRVKCRLTNCETGDRLITVKASTLKSPLPRTVQFGKFIGKMFHYGQVKDTQTKAETYKKCLEAGQKSSECTNDWKCLICQKSGHTRGDCNVEDKSQTKRAPPMTTNETDQSCVIFDQLLLIVLIIRPFLWKSRQRLHVDLVTRNLTMHI